MEITDVETILLSCPIPDEHVWKFSGIYEAGVKGVKNDMVIVRVHTDDGITGIGEPTPYGGAERLADAVERLEPHLVGRDPHDVDVITDPRRQPIKLSSGPDRYALAAINIACWDAIGKAAGQPVSKLLGGRYADEIEVYASGGIDWDYLTDPEILINEAESYLDRGFGAFKFRVGPDERFLEAMEALHDAVGEELDFIVEGNTRFGSPAEAVRMAEGFREFDPLWFEEPIDTDDLEGYREIRRALPDMRITGGEMRPSVEEFKPWIDRRAYDVVQPDANVMGISETRRVANRARTEGIACVPHSWHNAITMAANLHVVASIPNHDLLEFQQTWHWSAEPFRTAILEDPIEFEDGTLEVPDGPGLGIELDEDAIEAYPYEPGPIQEPWEGPDVEPRPI
jgi:L-alanine-DL-glutamate epimerase-like enolase superfamily enzyme